MVNKKYYFQHSETGQINITHFNYMLHKYLIQIKKKILHKTDNKFVPYYQVLKKLYGQ